jgi:hypothetical protein
MSATKIEKLNEKPFFDYIDEKTENQYLSYAVSYTDFDPKTSCLKWKITNYTKEPKNLILVRGTPEVQPYAFLNFFTEVYISLNAIKILTSPNESENYPYRVGLIENPSGQLNYGGIFYVPPKKSLIMEECGFSEQNNLPNFYQVYQAIYEKTNEYIVDYNLAEDLVYSLETDIVGFPISSKIHNKS